VAPPGVNGTTASIRAAAARRATGPAERDRPAQSRRRRSPNIPPGIPSEEARRTTGEFSLAGSKVGAVGVPRAMFLAGT